MLRLPVEWPVSVSDDVWPLLGCRDRAPQARTTLSHNQFQFLRQVAVIGHRSRSVACAAAAWSLNGSARRTVETFHQALDDHGTNAIRAARPAMRCCALIDMRVRSSR